MRVVYILLIVGFFYGCEKDPMSTCLLPDCSDTITSKFKAPTTLGQLPIEWYQPQIGKYKAYQNLFNFANDEGVMVVKLYDYSSEPMWIKFLERTDGVELFFWDKVDYSAPTDIGFYPESNRLLVKWDGISSVFDLKTKSEILFTKFQDKYTSTVHGEVIGDYLYTSDINAKFETLGNQFYSSMVRTKIGEGSKWEEVFAITKEEGDDFYKAFDQYRLWMHPHTGDSIVVFSCKIFDRPFFYGEGYIFVNLIAFNLNKNVVEWEMERVCSGLSYYRPLKLVDNHLFINANDGTKVVDLLGQNFINYKIEADIRVVDHERREAIAIQETTCYVLDFKGNILNTFELPDIIPGFFLEYFEGYIYGIGEGDDLIVVNAHTGKVVFQHYSEKMLDDLDNNGMRGTVSIDRKNRLLYCSDNWGIYCLQLPAKWE